MPKTSKKSTKQIKKQPVQRFTLKWWGKLALRLLIIGSVLAIGLLIWFGYDLPDIRTLEEAERQPSITMVTKDGDLLTTYGDLYGHTVTIEKLPHYVPKAVLSIEDHRFYSHFGIDFISFGRAVYNNLVKRRVVQGGSSITQQLAKNFLLSKKKFHYTDRSLRRKVQEVIVSFWLEYHFTKKQILAIYLNRVDFGAGVYGFDAAAQRFFFKPLNEISLFEASVLAGMLKAPTRYNPLRHPQKSATRAKVVIQKMIDLGHISASEGKSAIHIGTHKLLNRKLNLGSYRYFTDWLMDMLPSYLGYIDRDLKVVTTLNLKAQKAAEHTIKTMINKHGKERKFSEMALVSMLTNGEVVAMVGGKNYNQSQFNRVTQALRQPGSAFKTFVYTAAFEDGALPTDVMNDEPESYGKWKPKNIYNQYRGDLTLEEALAYSSNTITIKLLHKTGLRKLLNLVRKLGINTKLEHNLTLALGSGEVHLLDLTKAYAVIANNGREVIPYGIAEIRDNRTNELIYKSGAPHNKQLISEEAVKHTDQLLSAAVAYGTSKRSKLNNNIPSAGKSGTSQKYRDGWFVGYVKHPLGPVTGVWMGNDNDSPTNRGVGGLIPAQSWKMFHDMWMKPIANIPNIKIIPPHPQQTLDPATSEGIPSDSEEIDGIDQILSIIKQNNTETSNED